MQARKWGLFIVNGGLLVRYSSLAAKPGSVGHLTCSTLAHLALLRQAQMLLRFCARHKMLAPGTSASALLRQAQNASALSC